MAPKRSEQDLAKDLFMKTDQTQQQIADMLDVNRRTVWSWIKTGKWEEMKLAAKQMPGLILQDIFNHITAVNDKIREREPGDRCPTMEEVEKLRKLINMTNNIKKKSTGSYMESFAEILYYVRKKDHDLAVKLAPHIENYTTGTWGDNRFEFRKELSETVRQVMDNLKNMEDSVIAEPAFNTPNNGGSLDTHITPPSPSERAGVRLPDDTDNSLNEIIEREIRDLMGDQFDEKLFAEALNTPNYGGSLDTYVTPPSPSERAGVRPQCDNNVSIPPSNTNNNKPTKSATVLPHEQINNTSQPPHYHTGNFSENVITPVENNSVAPESELDKIMKLPIAERPSPFRDGNILWVSNIDDVDERYNNFGQEWGERKMGDSIRRYPDIDLRRKRA